MSWLPAFYDAWGGAWFVMVPRIPMSPGENGFMAYASYN